MSIYLGVDGGGTKTAFCLLDDAGDVVAEHHTRTLYYLTEGLDVVPLVLSEGVRAVCADAGLAPADIARAFVGLPGYGEVAADVPALDSAPRRALGHHRYDCGNDMICGWAGSLAASDGINVIAGTGSMTYGERDGHGVRVGGWGELIGDEGSAYWVALRALQTVSRMSDGREPDGPLREAFHRHLDISRDFDLLDVVLNRWHSHRGRIAGLSRVVAEVADTGDPMATAILSDGATELVLLATATARLLGYRGEDEIPVSWSGGMFTNPLVLTGFRNGLAAAQDRYAPVAPRFTPVVGAALYAARRDGRPLDDTALSRLASQRSVSSSSGTETVE